MIIQGRTRPLAPEIERGLLRITHEAVSNAVRHAAARTIRVGLSFDADALRLNVTDDGRGFDPEARMDHSRGHHFGLVGISERAQAMGGELRLESRPGHGTEIVCRLPYHCRTADPFDAADGRGSQEEGASL
jgi:signal transduction histidine kinase